MWRDNWPDVPTLTRRGCEEWRGAIQIPELGLSCARWITSLLRPLHRLLPRSRPSITLLRTLRGCSGRLSLPWQASPIWTARHPTASPHLPPPPNHPQCSVPYARENWAHHLVEAGRLPSRTQLRRRSPAFVRHKQYPSGAGDCSQPLLAESQSKVSDCPVYAPQRHTFQA